MKKALLLIALLTGLLTQTNAQVVRRIDLPGDIGRDSITLPLRGKYRQYVTTAGKLGVVDGTTGNKVDALTMIGAQRAMRKHLLTAAPSGFLLPAHNQATRLVVGYAFWSDTGLLDPAWRIEAVSDNQCRLIGPPGETFTGTVCELPIKITSN